jgi:hypothetical protein
MMLGGPVDLVALPRTTPYRGNLAAAIAALLDHADLAAATGRVHRACLATLVDELESVASAPHWSTSSNLWPLPCEGSAAPTRPLTCPCPTPHHHSSTVPQTRGDTVLSMASPGVVSVSGRLLASSVSNPGNPSPGIERVCAHSETLGSAHASYARERRSRRWRQHAAAAAPVMSIG